MPVHQLSRKPVKFIGTILCMVSEFSFFKEDKEDEEHGKSLKIKYCTCVISIA